MIEQVGACFHEHVVYVIEVFVPTVVWVGYFAQRMIRGVIHDQDRLGRMSMGRGQSAHVAKVVRIHGAEQVEAVEVGSNELSRSQVAYVDTISSHGGLCAAIRSFAHMIVSGARGIRFDLDATFVCEVAQHAFRHWRSADVAKADHEDLHGGESREKRKAPGSRRPFSGRGTSG